jgi:hypothetical protein
MPVVPRFTPVLFAALLLVGCEDGTEPLTGDASVRDSGPELPRDGGPTPIRDGGPRDGGRRDGGVEVVCQYDRSFDVQVAEYPRDRPDYDGLVEIVAIDPLVLRGEPGPAGGTPEWRFLASGAAWPRAMLRVGRTLQAEISIDEPFWTEVEAVLRDRDTREITLAFWAGGFEAASDRAVRITYQPQGCMVLDDGCGRQIGETLAVQVVDEQLYVAGGRQIVRDDLMIVNGRSASYVEPPECTDTPNVWRSGMFARRTGEIACADRQRDDCIATSGCVLWGSEEEDPGYACHDAATTCEDVASSEACANAFQCVWDPGACYCPEGEQCACGGGPAPKCRSACGDLIGACPASHYCEDGEIIAPECIEPTGAGGGVCTRVPLDCDGSPNRPQCSCAPGPVSMDFVNGCERRRARASGVHFGMCP